MCLFLEMFRNENVGLLDSRQYVYKKRRKGERMMEGEEEDERKGWEPGIAWHVIWPDWRERSSHGKRQGKQTKKKLERKRVKSKEKEENRRLKTKMVERREENAKPGVERGVCCLRALTIWYISFPLFCGQTAKATAEQHALNLSLTFNPCVFFVERDVEVRGMPSKHASAAFFEKRLLVSC